MDLLRQGEGVDEAVLAGGALAGHHGPDLGAGAPGLQAPLRQEGAQGFDILIGDPLDLQGQPGGHGHLSGAELPGGLRHGGHLLAGELAVDSDDPDVEMVRRPLVPQAPQPFYPGHLIFGQ